MKHAYLIMAHNEPYILEKQLKLIDYKDNDIYLHIDTKANDINLDEVKTWVKDSNLYLIKRMNVYWATNGQINCSLNLLKEAVNNGPYKYYHFISGIDMPLKKQEEIHEFFDKNDGKEFIHYSSFSKIEKDVLERVKYYHLLTKYARHDSKFIREKTQRLGSIFLSIQRKLKVDRTKGKDYFFGANWFDITDELAKYILSNEKYIKRRYKYTTCADEVFLQTLIKNTKFFDNLYMKEEGNYDSIKRCIDWKRGNPYVFRSEDYDLLMNSNNLFARKFSTKVDKEIIDKIYETLIK